MDVEAEVFAPGSAAGAYPHQAAAKPAAGKAAAAPRRVGATSKWGLLSAVTRGSKTNENMLVFRTLNRDMGLPNSNADDLAPLLRDKLMPLRSRWLAKAPGARAAFRRGLEHPKFGTPGVCNFVDARTKWLDQAVEAAIGAGITQVVVVAAGFDTRSYRFGAAAASQGQKISFFEVDLPGASQKKRELVDALMPASSYPRPAFIAADLAAVPLMDALERAGAGFDRSKPALFTVEGLVYYLPQASVAQLLGGIAARAAPGSRVAFDFLSAEVLDGHKEVPAYKVTARSVANKGELFISGLPNSAQGVQAFFNSPVRAAGGSAAAGQALKLQDYADAKEMAARQLPHLAWPEPGSGAAPPMLSFYSFVEAEVVTC